MRIILKIPDSMILDAMDDSVDLTVDLTGQATPKKLSRSAVKKKREAMSFIMAPDDQEIVDHWNDNDFIKQVAAGKITDARNRRVLEKDIVEVQRALRRAFRVMPKDEIKGHMDKYFAFCQAGDHIWDGANHGFKNLGGLLRKLVAYQKSQQLPWWEQGKFSEQQVEVVDLYPEITEIVATEYNQEFLGVPRGLDTTKMKDHKSFALVAVVLHAVAETRLMPLSDPIPELANCLVRCVRDVCGELHTIYPANMISDNVLQKAFPQYLYENFGLPASAMDGIVAAITDVLS